MTLQGNSLGNVHAMKREDQTVKHKKSYTAPLLLCLSTGIEGGLPSNLPENTGGAIAQS